MWHDKTWKKRARSEMGSCLHLLYGHAKGPVKDEEEDEDREEDDEEE